MYFPAFFIYVGYWDIFDTCVIVEVCYFLFILFCYLHLVGMTVLLLKCGLRLLGRFFQFRLLG